MNRLYSQMTDAIFIVELLENESAKYKIVWTLSVAGSPCDQVINGTRDAELTTSVLPYFNINRGGWVAAVVNATGNYGTKSPEFRSNGTRPSPRTHFDSLRRRERHTALIPQ